MRSIIAVALAAAMFFLVSAVVDAANQAELGTGNQVAITIAEKSPMVRSAFDFLTSRTRAIHDPSIRLATLDAITNPQTCIAHRVGLTAQQRAAIVQQVAAQGLLNPPDGEKIPGGLISGVFPSVLDDGGPCPHPPQRFTSAPGSSFGSHHSYPGGLAIHEAFNELTGREIAADYRAAYGHRDRSGLPIMHPDASRLTGTASDIELDEDVIIAAPIWHDWAKVIVYQWNADGTEFKELPLGGNGRTDNYGAPGDSRTGGHHILGLAETMARHLPPELIIAQASAHSAPTLGNEYKLVNWIRAGAIIARVDPIAAGYLRTDKAGRLRLPKFRGSRSLEMPAGDRPRVYFLGRGHR